MVIGDSRTYPTATKSSFINKLLGGICIAHSPNEDEDGDW